MEWSVSATALDAVIAAARAAQPAECCGLLIGQGSAILEAVPARNLDPSPARFLIDPADHIAARRQARQRGLHVMGFYHSHPHSPARPSHSDVAEATYADHLHLIVGLAEARPVIGLFRLSDGNFQEVAFVTVP